LVGIFTLSGLTQIKQSFIHARVVQSCLPVKGDYVPSVCLSAHLTVPSFGSIWYPLSQLSSFGNTDYTPGFIQNKVDQR
jgi:hypothetical protein